MTKVDAMWLLELVLKAPRPPWDNGNQKITDLLTIAVDTLLDDPPLDEHEGHGLVRRV